MKKGCLITIIILLLGAIGFCWYLYFNIKIPIGQSGEKRFFEVKDGEGTIEVSEDLKAKKLIRAPWIFAYYVKLRNITLYPGIYYLSENMNMDQIIDPLASQNIEEYKITIPEGWRNTQIAEYLAENNIIKSEDFNKAAEGKEGYLFPDTYRIPIDITAVELVGKMEDNFKERTKDLKPSNDDIILASIVEREAKKNEDRAKIAGVYLNRLEKNMYLGADPTIQYAKGNWNPINKKDLETDSPYNTYLNRGLPPTPICNPGLESIKAVLNPEKNGWLYFFHLDDGTTIFSENAQEHEANKAKYKDRIAN